MTTTTLGTSGVCIASCQKTSVESEPTWLCPEELKFKPKSNQKLST